MMTNRLYILYIYTLLLLGAAPPTFAQTINGNVYGGGQLGKVAGNTSVTIESGTIETGASGGSNIFGGGYQAEVAGNTTIDINGGEAGNVYGGGEAANIVVGAAETGKTVVNMNGGTVHHSIYGGGLGNTTNVATSTTVTANGGTVTEDVYGGSGFGKVGATAVIINNGATVTRDVFGGGFGSTSPNNYEADVNGAASVTINKGAKISGNVYGGNNTNGSPKGAITVLVDGPMDEAEKTATPLVLKDVFGGGKNAATTSSTNDIPAPKVTIKGCETIIARVFGGGDAASAPATDVEIWGGHIGNGFAGGNGEVVAAHVGYLADGTTPYTYGTGNTNIVIKGGVIENVFGGSNTAGNIRGEVSVTVEKDDEACDMQITNLYGGGNEAPGKAGTISIVCTGEDGRIENVYGGANRADVTGDITLNIKGGQITNVFGGNNNSGTINGAITVNVDWATGVDACGTNSLTNVYGGGNLAPYTTPVGKVGPTVNLINGTVSNNVYGGGYGEDAVVTGNPEVNLIGGTVTNDIFGGGDAAPVIGNPLINANYGSVKDIFAGGRGETAVVTGDPLAYVNKTDDKELTVVDVYGGGDAANVGGTGNVQLDKGTVRNIYGGGNAANVTNTEVVINGGEAAMAFAGGHGDKDAVDSEGNPAPTEANVTVNAHLTIHGGTVTRAFAGSNSKGTITGEQVLTIVKTGDALAELHVTEVYGGGNQADGNAGTITIGCTGDFEHNGEGIGDVYGGANAADITNAIELTITGGHINRVFGGNNASGSITGPITVNVDWDDDPSCDQYLGDVFGGGNEANYSNATTVNMKKGTVNNIYGGGNQAGVGTATVNMSGGNVLQGLYGGCNTSGTVTGAIAVTVTNGTVGTDAGHTANVHGGGYGSATATNGNVEVTINQEAEKTVTIYGDVYGGSALGNVNDATDDNTTVTITAGTVNGNVYGGGLGDADNAAQVNGDVLVSINGGAVNGSVFGCNNTNGTPKGHVKVHVTKTTPRDGQTSGQYDVAAVYGGGNKAAYEPTSDTDFAEVLIENCDNSIEYVYGGGNAAPVPATRVTIHGANAINHAFAGGNGKTELGQPQNPGADVGYLGFYSSGTSTTYGSGTASITVDGGTVHNVYGGSNTLGYIRGTTVNVADGDGTCPLLVDNVFGGGNEAPMDCDITMTIDCSDGGKVLYAGANNADVNGDITLNIHSGTYEQVFCGNNQGGAVRGKLEVNVDETGCTPIIIKELFGGGNLAAYSVYGYDVDGSTTTPRATLNEEWKNGEGKYIDPISNKELKPEEGYGNPTINVISCTAIGTVYGGGYGSTAVMYGNPIVNVDMVLGDGAKGAITRAFNVIKDGEFFTPSESPVIPNSIGVIGNIFGGGKEAAVYGNTTVNVCVKEQSEVKHPKDDSAVGEETDANIAPLPEDFITYGLVETTPSTTLIDYQHADVLSSGMRMEGETTAIRSDIKIDNNSTTVNAINLKDSYASKQDQVVLSTTGGFKKGDKISVSGFYNHSESVKPSQIAFFYKDKTSKPFAVTSPLINAYNTAGEPKTEVFTVGEDTEEILVRRDVNGGTSQTYIYTLNVTRPTFVPEEKPIGSIYGGGKLANVYGNTKVHIRNGSVEGNVFGAGQGDAAQPDAAAVSGKTKVIIGEEE